MFAFLRTFQKDTRPFAFKDGEPNFAGDLTVLVGERFGFGEAILLIREVIIRDGRHYRTADILLAELALIACYSLAVSLARIDA